MKKYIHSIIIQGGRCFVEFYFLGISIEISPQVATQSSSGHIHYTADDSRSPFQTTTPLVCDSISSWADIFPANWINIAAALTTATDQKQTNLLNPIDQYLPKTFLMTLNGNLSSQAEQILKLYNSTYSECYGPSLGPLIEKSYTLPLTFINRKLTSPPPLLNQGQSKALR